MCKYRARKNYKKDIKKKIKQQKRINNETATKPTVFDRLSMDMKRNIFQMLIDNSSFDEIQEYMAVCKAFLRDFGSLACSNFDINDKLSYRLHLQASQQWSIYNNDIVPFITRLQLTGNKSNESRDLVINLFASAKFDDVKTLIIDDSICFSFLLRLFLI